MAALRDGEIRLAPNGGADYSDCGIPVQSVYACFSQIAESTRNNFGAGLTTNDPDFLTASNR